MGCKSDLEVDQAWLNVTNNADYGIQLFTQSAECDQCTLLSRAAVDADSFDVVKVNTSFATLIAISKHNTSDVSPLCRLQYHFGEYGKYLLEVNKDGNENAICGLKTETSPVNNNLYILWAFLIFLGMYIVWLTGIIVYRKKIKSEEEDERLLVSDLGSPSEAGSGSHIWSFAFEPNAGSLRERLKSLDTFRGICIVVMIFVNYGGGQYWFFHHATWNGLTVADLVFPWFMWIMGTSIAFSLQSQLRKGITKKRIFLKIVRRSVILFGLGLILNSKYKLGCELSEMRILGVLQRFGITYLIVANMYLLTETLGDTYWLQSRVAVVRDIFAYWQHWLLMSLIVAAHLVITFVLPVPGCPTGYLGPGGLHLYSSHPDCTGGAAGYIDRLVLGENHMHRKSTAQDLYETTVRFDPEGILGYLSATFTVFLGLQAGKILIMYHNSGAIIKRLVLWAIITGGLGTLLCQASQNDGWIPVNKNLWSMSFVLVTSALAFMLLTICYILVDMAGWWSGSPFIYPGMNAILLYVGHTITEQWFPWDVPAANAHLPQFCLDLWGTSLWVLIAIWLYYSNQFFKV